MSAAAAPVSPSRFRGSILPKPAPPAPRRTGTDPAALTELRNAAATFDFLRRKGDRAEFWEVLRLARSRRALLAPPEGEAPAPAPEIEAAIVHELYSIRSQYASMVRDVRRYLENVPGLPEPFDRLEMALAFLLASAREHQAVAKWIAEPGKHEAKAAEKLRSLATITDPYREALEPWVLHGPIQEKAPRQTPVAVAPELPAAAPAPARAQAPTVNFVHVDNVRRGMLCRELLAGIRIESELWETMLPVTLNSSAVDAALRTLLKDLEGDLVRQAKGDREALEKLYGEVTAFRQMYGDWVRSIRSYLVENQLAPEDPRMFDVGLAFLIATPGAQDRLGPWLDDATMGQEEVLGLLGPWMMRAKDYLAALHSPRA